MRADDDLDAEVDLRHRSFGPMSIEVMARHRAELADFVGTGRLIGIWDAGQLVGSAGYHDMLQYWHGRPVMMAGVGGVKVAPEARGRGVGRAMMTGLLAEMARQGYVLSTLYPATAQIYRSLGWELAGGNYRAEVPGRSLGALLPADQALPLAGQALSAASADSQSADLSRPRNLISPRNLSSPLRAAAGSGGRVSRMPGTSSPCSAPCIRRRAIAGRPPAISRACGAGWQTGRCSRTWPPTGSSPTAGMAAAAR